MEYESKHLIADIPQKAIIEKDGKVLIVRDPHKESWELPGGRLHKNEEPAEGLKREIREELSIEIEPQSIFDAFVFTSASGTSHFAVVYIAKINGNFEIKLDNNELAGFKWVGESDLTEIKILGEYGKILNKYFENNKK